MSWEADAACRGMGPSLFFPEPTSYRRRGSTADSPVYAEAIETARRVCDRCPVTAECLDEHMEMRDAVVGGTSWAERSWMLRQAEQSARRVAS